MSNHPSKEGVFYYVIYSANEAVIGAGFWSIQDGWITDEADATVFTVAETAQLDLPFSTGMDARWKVTELRDAHARFLTQKRDSRLLDFPF